MKNTPVQLNNSTNELTQTVPAGGIGTAANIIWGKRAESGGPSVRA